MEELEKIKFKNSWDNYLEKRFWKKVNELKGELNAIYLFDFGSLSCEIQADENGILYLCYIFDEREKSGNPLIDHPRNENVKSLQDIFFNTFPNCNHEKYLGYYAFSKNENYKNRLRAFFLLGNELKNLELKNFMLDKDTKIIYDTFKNSDIDADYIFDFYISEIIQEFENINKIIKHKIFENDGLKLSSEKMLSFPFINHF